MDEEYIHYLKQTLICDDTLLLITSSVKFSIFNWQHDFIRMIILLL